MLIYKIQGEMCVIFTLQKEYIWTEHKDFKLFHSSPHPSPTMQRLQESKSSDQGQRSTNLHD